MDNLMNLLNKDPFEQIGIHSSWITMILIVLVLLALYFILPWLTEVLLGSDWRVSGEYIRLLLPWLLVMTAVAPIGFIPDVFGQQKVGFILEIVYMLLTVGALSVGIALRDFRLAMLCYSLLNTLMISGQMAWYAWLIRRYDRSVQDA